MGGGAILSTIMFSVGGQSPDPPTAVERGFSSLDRSRLGLVERRACGSIDRTATGGQECQ